MVVTLDTSGVDHGPTVSVGKEPLADVAVTLQQQPREPASRSPTKSPSRSPSPKRNPTPPPSPPRRVTPARAPSPIRRPPTPRQPSPEPFHDSSFMNFANPAKTKEPTDRDRPAKSPSPPPQEFFGPSRGQQQPRPPHATIEDEKEAIIIELFHLQPEYAKPIPRFTMSSGIADMRLQLRLVKEELEASEGIQFYESASLLQTGITERINQQFNPLDVDMAGLSEHHHASIHLFRKVFRRLYNRYGTPTKNPIVEYLVVYFGMVYTYVLAKRCAEAVSSDNLRNMMGQAGAAGKAPAGMPDLAAMMQSPQVQQALQALGQGRGGGLQEMLQNLVPPQQPPAPQPPPRAQMPQPSQFQQAPPVQVPQQPPQRAQMPQPTFVQPPVNLTRQPSGLSAAATEESNHSGDEPASPDRDSVREIRVRGRGRGRRGRGRTVALL